MNAQQYLDSRLHNLNTPLGLAKPANDQALAEAIFKIIMSKKYRKYAAEPAIAEHIKRAIVLNIKNREPINVTTFHGAYKLWRLDEAPEPDWAELFAAMHYTNWLRPICEMYEPGVWFDYFVDDYIVPLIDAATEADQEIYMRTYRDMFKFLSQHQPANFKMVVTGVGEQFLSRQAFKEKLMKDIEQYATKFPGGLPEISEKHKASLYLNANPTPKARKDPQWAAKNTLMHDAYSITKRETGYYAQPHKILAFTTPIPGKAIGVGTTRASIAKFWAGVGVLKPRGTDDFDQIILSPSQLEHASYDWQPLAADGLDGKNFKRIRVLTAPAA
jgi:hypothetical protein